MARRFTTIPTRDLFTYQQIITNPAINADQLAQVAGEAGITTSDDPSKVIAGSEGTNTGSDGSSGGASTTTGNPMFAKLKQDFINLGWYFHNDVPGPKRIGALVAESPWDVTYNAYTGMTAEYQQRAGTGATEVMNTFSQVIEYNAEIEKTFQKDIVSLLTKNPKVKVTLTMAGSASAPNTQAYNVDLSKRRLSSVLEYFKSSL